MATVRITEAELVHRLGGSAWFHDDVPALPVRAGVLTGGQAVSPADTPMV
jgi:hypothetical protein